MKIKELVKIDQQGEFISAVQLSDFDNPNKNTQLVRHYIFSESTPNTFGLEKRYFGSIDLLDKFRNSFISNTNNVLMVLADYGHGKSHFALESMNYFEKPYESSEVKTILERIQTSIPHNNPKSENFKTFKKARDRFLTLSLSGDSGKSIQELLYAALKKGLSRHPATQNASLPFWNSRAINWLNERRENKKGKEFLAKTFKTDFVNLTNDVLANKDGAWDQYASLFEHLNDGELPDPKGKMNPKEVLNWVIDKYIGEGKPFSGLVLFFDEFSQFIRVYINGKMDGSLQLLLSGVAENKQKALFIGLGHHDPIETARSYARNDSTISDISKELTRLEEKINLYSLVESILDSYLAHSMENWETLINENPIAKGGFLGQTAEYSWDLYLDRYEKELHWDNAKFREVVVKGCYPLHPTTTGLLAHLKMVSDISDDARTMLRFVRDVFDVKNEEEVMVGNKVNWVYPIDLVDYFKDKIAEPALYSEYSSAMNNLHTILAENVTENQVKMLKAILLQRADQKLKYNKFRQIELLSHYCGLTTGEGNSTLNSLREHNILRYEEYPGVFTFWPTGIDLHALEIEVKKQMSTKKFDLNYLIKMEARLSKQSDMYDGFKPIEINLDWGHPSEWAAHQTLVIRENFTPENLRKLLPPIQLGPGLLKQPVKGVVVWCLALYDEDIAYFKQKSADILETAFADMTSPPVLLVLPSENQSDLTNQYIHYEILLDLLLNEKSKKTFGTDQINGEIQKSIKNLQQKFLRFFAKSSQITKIGESYVFPKMYIASITTQMLIGNPFQKLLEALYRSAYSIRPNSFFNQYKGYVNSKATSATKKIATMLAKNNLGALLRETPAGPVEDDLIKYLVYQWKILSPTYFVMIPDNNPQMKTAWNLLDENIKADKKEIKLNTFFAKLFSAPFGFDFNSALLLFSAWVGFHNKEIRFTRSNREVTTKEVFDQINTSAKPTSEIVHELLFKDSLSITREDPGKIETEVKAILDKIQTNNKLPQPIAESYLVKLTDFLEKEKGSGNSIEVECKNAYDTLVICLADASAYNTAMESIKIEIAKLNDISVIKKIENRIINLKLPQLIETTQPNLAELQKGLDVKVELLVEKICCGPSNLGNLENVGIVRNQITDAIKELSDRIDLDKKLKEGLGELERKANELRSNQNLEKVRIQIDLISENSGLKKLQDDLSYIQSMDYSENANSLIEAKIERISGKIVELQQFADAALERYTSIDENELRLFKDQVLSRANLYECSSYQPKLQAIKAYTDLLDQYFSDLKMVSILDTTNLIAVQKGVNQIAEIAARYNEKISQTHLVKLTFLQNQFNNLFNRLAEAIENQLCEVESVLAVELKEVSGTLDHQNLQAKIEKIRSNNLDGLKNRLDKSENDLKKIKTEMDERFAIEQIEKLFKSLDRNKKVECLQKLQNL